MLIRITLTLDATSRKDLRFYLNRLVSLNRYLMRTRRVPPLYKSGVFYAREASGAKFERWQTCIECMRTRACDCEDLASWRVAELQERGEDAKIRLSLQSRTWHVTVRRANGQIEDPSKILGMETVMRKEAYA